MILWEEPFKITEKIKSEKGNNYKGHDIGPFIRLCNKCKINKMEYLSYDAMLKAEQNNYNCSSCNKGTKGTEGKFSKKCGNDGCENLIFYKRKGDLTAAIKSNSTCRECRTKEIKEKNKNGIFKNKTEKELKEIKEKNTISKQKYWDEHPEEFKLLKEKRAIALSNRNMNKFQTEEYKKKMSEIMKNVKKKKDDK